MLSDINVPILNKRPRKIDTTGRATALALIIYEALDRIRMKRQTRELLRSIMGA